MQAASYLTFQHKTYRTIDLHFHSKLFEGFTIYLDKREVLP